MNTHLNSSLATLYQAGRPRPWLAPVRSSAKRARVARHSLAEDAEAASLSSGLYFVATNNFKVKPDHFKDFENIWITRESHLKETPGFIRFALLRGDEPGEYISQSHWASRQDFEQWTKSQQFQKAHKGVPREGEGQNAEGKTEAKRGGGRPAMTDILEGRPQPKFYEAVTVTDKEGF